MTEQSQEGRAGTGRGMPQHVQTLVGMNHCVGTARRDAVYQCLLSYVNRMDREKMCSEVPSERVLVYRHCLYLLLEAVTSTRHATLSYERSGIKDRPAFHILKMLYEMMRTMTAMVTYVQMVHEEAAVLQEPIGVHTYAHLSDTGKMFEMNERLARGCFFDMLNVGVEILASSTARHREAFSEDEERRYRTAYAEYLSVYSKPDTFGSARSRDMDII